MRFDPDAVLGIPAVDVDVAGQTFTIPPHPAAVWMLALNDGGLLDIVPGMLEEPDVLDDQFEDNPHLAEECVAAARHAIAAVSGTAWWSAARLAVTIPGSWIGAELAVRGIDPDRLSLGSYLHAAYHLAVKHMDDAKASMFEMQLDAPPQGVAPDEWWDEDAVADNFMAALAGQG